MYINGNSDIAENIRKAAEAFERDGFAFVENFLSDEEVEALRQESRRLIYEESVKERKHQIFGNEYNAKSEYFVQSGSKIGYFYEKKAFKEGTSELNGPIDQSIAKIGHALHALNPVFKAASTNKKIKDVFRAIKFNDPTILQSMVIFKNPKVGGEYTPHQDGSFLTTDPPEHVAGIWLALDDATAENGCLEFIPGSHRLPLLRRFVRSKSKSSDALIEWTSPPNEYQDDQFVSVPVKRGDMVLIHGLVIHRSAANQSNHARWIYTFHVYDKGQSVYLNDNWLQPEINDTFIPIFAN